MYMTKVCCSIGLISISFTDANTLAVLFKWVQKRHLDQLFKGGFKSENKIRNECQNQRKVFLIPDQANQQTNHKAPECTRLIGSGPEYSQEVDSADWRGQEAGDRLDVDKELGSLGTLYNWNPGNADTHQGKNKTSS